MRYFTPSKYKYNIYTVPFCFCCFYAFSLFFSGSVFFRRSLSSVPFGNPFNPILINYSGQRAYPFFLRQRFIRDSEDTRSYNRYDFRVVPRFPFSPQLFCMCLRFSFTNGNCGQAPLRRVILVIFISFFRVVFAKSLTPFDRFIAFPFLGCWSYFS